jgi:uncharacterized repeat protein (TIGR01451 family)
MAIVVANSPKKVRVPHSFLSRATFALCAVVAALYLAPATAAWADTPVTLYKSFAGNINITGTGGTLRTQRDTADGGNSCTVTNSGSIQLLGVPTGSSIVAAYLYWAGSGGDPVGGVGTDYNVTFNGVAIGADRTYTANYNAGGGNNVYFFGGVKDVTSAVTGNGTYTFADLTVQTANVSGGGQYCGSSAVLSAFSLVVIYSHPSETLHVVNLWEGFQGYRGGAIPLTPTNFVVPTPAPTTALSSRILVLTWEGDNGNSAPLDGFSENLTFCSPAPCGGTALTDAYNPLNNQFNSTVDIPPNGPFSGINTTWGLDIDMFDITSRLPAGAASAQSVYSSGGDLVILMNQTMSVTNVPVADLAITKSHTDIFTVGSNGVFTLNVTNNGPSATSGTITMTDTLPTGLTYVSATGSGWTCGAAGQTVTCTRPSSNPLASGATAPPITLTTAVGLAAAPSVTNSASVSSDAFDNNLSNNTASNTATVDGPTTGTKLLYLYGTAARAADKLSRTVNTSTDRVNFTTLGTQTWTMNPVAAADITIDPAVNPTVPVWLRLRRESTDGNRTIKVDLQCGGGPILTLTRTINLNINETMYPFALPLATPVTCSAGSSWLLTVSITANTQTNGMRLYFNNTAENRSRVELPATTVINVDTITYYDAPYPAGNVVTSVDPGETVYIRAVVSDPFGSYDINASNTLATRPDITITNPSGTTVVTADMTELGALTTASSKTFEYSAGYTIPTGGPTGNWTVRVDATEGTEGTVTDFGLKALPVPAPMPNLLVVKSSQVFSDPINGAGAGAKAIPGAFVDYTIQVTNFGAGAVDNNTTVITDPIPANTELFVGDFDDVGPALGPILFTNGTTVSGLSYTFTSLASTTDNLAFSGNNGTDFYLKSDTAPDSNECDPTVTNIKIPLSGIFNGSDGTNHPSFNVKFRVRIK